MRVYATAAQYFDFVGEDDPNEGVEPPTVDKQLAARLRRASTQVESHLRAARYDVDEDGYPTDPAIAEALRDATCAYAAYWDETDDITGAGAMEGPVRILSVSLGGTATGGASSRTVADTRRADEAVTILRNAGLISAITAHN